MKIKLAYYIKMSPMGNPTEKPSLTLHSIYRSMDDLSWVQDELLCENVIDAGILEVDIPDPTQISIRILEEENSSFRRYVRQNQEKIQSLLALPMPE